MHSYYSNSVYLHTFVKTDVSIFWLKCAKLSTFYILQIFTITDVVTLRAFLSRILKNLAFTIS